MSDIISPIDLKGTIPSSLLNQFWSDFLNTISTELNNFKIQIGDKAHYLDIESYIDSASLIELSKSFGYVPNLQLSSDLSTVQRETASIFYKIKNKSISNYYLYIFKLAKRIGKVFNSYKDYTKLIRAVDFVAMAANLNAISDYTIPFTGLTPNTDFNKYRSQIATLDATLLLFFDAIDEWFFDNPNQILPTQNLIFEYDIDRLVGNFTLTPEYFRFLEQAVLYGKKTTTFPHIGGLLNMITDEDIFFDTYDVHHIGYSMPSLKMQTSCTPFYKPINLSPIITLDAGRTFDEEIIWLFDIDSIVGLPESIDLLFKQIVVGSGKKSLYSNSNPNVNFNLILYYPFDEEYGSTVIDDSTNGFNGTVFGNYQRQQGIIGRSILYDGLTVKTQVPLTLSNSNKTFTFWINPSVTQNFSNAIILHQTDYLDMSFNTHEQAITTIITGSLGSVVLSANLLANINSQVVLQLDTVNHLAILYVNGTLIDLVSISGIGSLVGSGNLVIGSDGTSNYFKGTIDELRIYSSLLSANDIMYLYNNMIGSLRSLDHRLWTGDLSFNELYEDTKWKSVNSWAPALTKNKEFIAQSDGSLTSVSGAVELSPIVPGYTIIDYIGNVEALQVIDDGLGNLLARAAQGTIDYTTGIYDLNFHRDYQVLNFSVPFTSRVYIDYFILNLPLRPNTISLEYTIGSTAYIATDNGIGGLVGIGISSGSINYATGELIINFISPIDTSTSIFLSYIYRLTLLPDNGTLIMATYKLASTVDITEAGILNQNNEMVLYSTFPPMRFDSIRNHFASAFHVIKP